MMLTDQSVRVAFVPKPHRYCQSTELGNNYKNASSTNMNSSSRVSPFTLSTRSFGLESLSRSRLPKIHDKNQANQSLFSPLTVESDQEKFETKKLEVSVSKNKKQCPLTLATLLGIIAGVLSLAAVAMSIYTLLAKTATTTTTTPPTLRWNSTGTTVAGMGVYGTAANQLSSPIGLALDSSNTLYIGDLNNSRVQKWPMGAWLGTTVAGQANGAPGSVNNSLNQAGGIAIDSADGIYVVDIFNSRVQYWSNGASSGTTLAGTGSSGNSTTQLSYPYTLTRDPSSGTLYIADTNNHRVMQYHVGASPGTVVAGGNGAGCNNTQLNYPIGLYFDSSSNSLVIANAGANNIVRWVLGDTSWTLLAGSANGTMGATSTMMHYPVGVTFDSWGNMYVADTYNHRIQFFLAGQSSGTTIVGVATISGSNSTLLKFPYNLILDADLNLYVADSMNHRVQKFLRY